MYFANPLGLLALISLPAILIMYLLKQKHQDTLVPSHFLWNKTLSSAHAQKPWQKLRKNLLLFLQLLMALLLSLGLANPVVRGGNGSEAYIYVLDASMSMQAKGEDGSRFDIAKEAIRQSIGSAPAASTYTIVSMGSRPEVLVSNTAEKAKALSALEGCQPQNGKAGYEEMATLTTLLQEQTGGNLYLYTDEPLMQQDFIGQVVYVGAPASNVAISLISATAGTEGITALVRLESYGEHDETRTLSIYGDNQVLEVADVSLAPGEKKDIYFENIPLDTQVLFAQVTPEDALAADDVRYAVLQEGAKTKALLVTEQNIFLEKVLSLMPGVTSYRGDVATVEGYGLYVYDGQLPETLPTDGHLLLINPTENPLFLVEDVIEVSDINRMDSAFFGGKSTADFAVSKAKKLVQPPWAKTLLATEETPLIFIGTKGEQKIGVIGFDLHDSDLPLKLEFPMLMYAFNSWFFPDVMSGAEDRLCGEEISFALDPGATEALVITPEKQNVSLAPPFPAKTLKDTDMSGVYTLQQVKGEETISKRFSINPDTAEESDLRSIGEETETNVVKNTGTGSMSLQKPLLLLVLVVLAIEWVVNCRARKL